MKTERDPQTNLKSMSESKSGHPSGLFTDDDLLSSFDPVIEGGGAMLAYSEEEAGDRSEALEVLASFDLGESLASIPEKLFFRIGEVAELLDVKPYVLRFWETEFSSVSPSKSKSGQRVYRKKHVETLMLIKHLLYVERFSIEGARKRLREMKSGAATTAGAAVTAPSTEASKDLRSIVDRLKELSQFDPTRFFRF